MCDVRSTASGGGKPVVVICHSFMAFREWGFFPHVATRFAEEGFVSVSFDFSRNGVVAGGNRITDFDRFASNTFRREIEDLGHVVRAIRREGLAGPDGDASKIVLLGHSRGGGIAVAHASTDPDLAGLVTWSAIATFDRWTEHQKREWREKGYLPLSAGSGGRGLRMGPGILEEVSTVLRDIDPVLRASYIKVPWLILHGRADVTVPVREAEILHAAADERFARLLVLEAVGHLYNARTPDEDHYMTINHIITLTADWLRGQMS